LALRREKFFDSINLIKTSIHEFHFSSEKQSHYSESNDSRVMKEV
jgi:hypothetical protein